MSRITTGKDKIPKNSILARIFGLRQGFKDKSCPGQEIGETRTRYHPWLTGLLTQRFQAAFWMFWYSLFIWWQTKKKISIRIPLIVWMNVNCRPGNILFWTSPSSVFLLQCTVAPVFSSQSFSETIGATKFHPGLQCEGPGSRRKS